MAYVAGVAGVLHLYGRGSSREDDLVSAAEVWGKEDGYCAWCVDTLIIGEPIWEYAADSLGDNVKYACCAGCAAEREVKKGGE